MDAFSENIEEGVVLIDKNIQISSESRWCDETWYLDNPSPGQRNKIGWRFQLISGGWSTDLKNKLLLESFKEVFWGMLKDGSWFGKTLSSGSSPSFSSGMRELFRWMTYFKKNSFAELDEESCRKYVSDIPILLINRREFYGNVNAVIDPFDYDSFFKMINYVDAGKFQCADPDRKFTYAQVSYRIKMIFYIFAQKSRLTECGLPAMVRLPFDGKRFGDLARQIVSHTISRIPPLPDEVALPLLQSALEWIESNAEDVIKIQNLLIELRRSELSKRDQSKVLKEELSKFSFPLVLYQAEGWGYPHKASTDDASKFEVKDVPPSQAVRRLVNSTRDACVLILEYFVGLRVGEICGIVGGWNSSTKLPQCIDIRYSKSGIMEMFFLKSVLSKGQVSPIDSEWLLGCRPVGASKLPPPIRALIILEKLFSPWRILGKRNGLIVSFTQRKSLPTSSSSIERITTSSLTGGIQNFIFTHVDLSSLPDSSKRGEDLTIYKKSKGSCIWSHQGRKTFAAYMLETRSCLLPAVSEHFKHMNIEITESAYFSSNSRFRSEGESLRSAETVAFFVEAIQGRPIYGGMASTIMEYFRELKWNEQENHGELVRRVTDLVETHDLRIFFSDYGKCLIKANPLESRCRQATGVASWNLDTPDYSSRNPSMCSGCSCFVFDSTNLPYWKRRLEEYLEVVKKSDKISHEFRVHLARAHQAQKIVRLLEVSNGRKK